MTTNRVCGLLLAILILGCDSSSGSKKIPGGDAATTGGDGAAPDTALPAERPADAATETAAPSDTPPTTKSDAAALDGGPGADAARDTAQATDAFAPLDQQSALDTAGRPDGGTGIDATAGLDSGAADVSFTLPDVSFTLPDVSLPDVSFNIPDISALLPDLGAPGTNCAVLAACCPSLSALLQSMCTTAVATDTDNTCATLLLTLKLAGDCP
jgi:hypothetical protein